MTAAVDGRHRAGTTLAAALRTVPAVVRTTSWTALAVGAAVATLAVWQGRAGESGPGAVIEAGWYAAIALGATAGFWVEDAAAVMTAAVPVGLWWRRAVRIAVPVLATAVGWLAVLVVLRADPALARDPGVLPTGGLTVRLAAMVAVALAATAVVQRAADIARSGLAGMAAVLVLVAVCILPPIGMATYPTASADWATAQQRWAVLLGAAMALLAAASTDPAARLPIPHRTRLRTPSTEVGA